MQMLEFHLEVTDVEAALAIYSRLIKHDKIERWNDGNTAAIVLPDGSAFGLWRRGHAGIHGGRGGEHVHFAFKIASHEYEKYSDLIVELGMKPLSHVWPNGHRSVYFCDPDGHQGEFMTGTWLD